MDEKERLRQLASLKPVPPPPQGPTYEHIVGNQIRWTVKVLRYWRYQRRLRKLQQISG